METDTLEVKSTEMPGSLSPFAPIVSWFPDAYENLPLKDAPISEFVEAIRRGTYRSQVSGVRSKFRRALERGATKEKAKKTVDKEKKRLPSVTGSGVFSTRTKDGLTKHSELVQVDLDLVESAESLRKLLKDDPHCYCVFESVTGEGLKAFYRVPPCRDDAEHKQAHIAVADHVKNLTGLDMDETCDVDRLCFTSYDPGAYLNPDAEPLPILYVVTDTHEEAPPTRAFETTPRVCSSSRQEIAERILGDVKWESGTEGFCTCPGKDRHTNGDSPKDCKVWLRSVPTVQCFHTSCASAIDAVNHRLRSEIGKAEYVPEKRVSLQTESPSTLERFTELDFANLLADQGPPIRTVGSKWHAFDGAWREVSRDSFRPKAQAILPPIFRTARHESALLDHLEGRFQVSSDSFRGFYCWADDQRDILINAANGVVRVQASGETTLQPHDPDLLFTLRTDAAFDPGAKAELFERVLAEVLPDIQDRALIQLAAGNFLYPDARFEVALTCYGEAGRGKSTAAEPICNALGRALVPRLTMSQICDPRSYHVPKLRFAAVNMGTELDAVELGDSGPFKQIVSGEPIEARPIYGSPFTMNTYCKLWFLANSLPRFKHGTEAELRRTRFLRFDYLPPHKDVTLKARLNAERDGVFLWMLRGLAELMNLPTIPLGGKESRSVHERFKVSNDPLGTFVSCHCNLDRNASVSKTTLQQAYGSFCETYDLRTGLADCFFRNLYERWPSVQEKRARVDGGRERRITGINLNEL